MPYTKVCTHCKISNNHITFDGMIELDFYNFFYQTTQLFWKHELKWKWSYLWNKIQLWAMSYHDWKPILWKLNQMCLHKLLPNSLDTILTNAAIIKFFMFCPLKASLNWLVCLEYRRLKIGGNCNRIKNIQIIGW